MSARALVLTILFIPACQGHGRAPSLKESRIQVLSPPDLEVELGELAPWSEPLTAVVYNTTQDARGALAEDLLAEAIPEVVVLEAVDEGLRAALQEDPAAPAVDSGEEAGDLLEVEILRWGLVAELPGAAGELQVTVQGRLYLGEPLPLRTPPLTCSRSLTELDEGLIGEGPVNNLRLLEELDPMQLRAAMAEVARTCSGRAVAHLESMIEA